MFTKLSHKYAALGVVVFTLVIVIVMSITVYSVQHRTKDLRDELTEHFKHNHTEFVVNAFQNDSRYMSDRLFNPLYNFDVSAVNEEVRRIFEWLKPEQILILDHEGTIVSDGKEENSRFGQLLDISRYKSEQNLTVQPLPDQNIHRLAFPISTSDWLAGYAIIDLSTDRDQEIVNTIEKETENQLKSFYQYYIWLALASLILMFIVGGLVALRLTRSISNPLQEMIHAAEEFASGKLEYQMPNVVNGENEISRLADALQSMAKQIDSAEKRILKQAHFDDLTGLPNRFLSLDRLEQLIREAEREDFKVAVLFLDLDDFKKVNDTMGHDEGDNILVQAAQRLRNAVRKTDIVGRLGGDEFLIITGNIREPSAIQTILDSLLDAFREPFYTLQKQKMTVTLSIGVSIFPSDVNTKAGLLRSADLAMYHAKKSGRNSFSFFTEEMNQAISRRVLIENELHNALAEDQLFVVFQPKYCLRTNKILGVETLVRWKSPRLGMVPPDEFIAVAEHTGQIFNISEFVIARSFEELQTWRELEPNFEIAINLSPRQFNQENFIVLLDALVNAYNINPNGIEFELTEGVLIRSEDRARDVLEKLSGLGFSLAMDDFGTGYSSLVHLRTYPFDVIKIDRTFVNDICEDPEDRILIEATIAMAQALNMKTVAEGIETLEQLEKLKELGCDIGQGYYLSRPVEPERITQLLSEPVPA